MRLLPPAHARILALAEQGFDTDELAGHLGLDSTAVGPLLEVARAKLAALEALDEPPDDVAPSPARIAGAGD